MSIIHHCSVCALSHPERVNFCFPFPSTLFRSSGPSESASPLSTNSKSATWAGTPQTKTRSQVLKSMYKSMYLVDIFSQIPSVCCLLPPKNRMWLPPLHFLIRANFREVSVRWSGQNPMWLDVIGSTSFFLWRCHPSGVGSGNCAQENPVGILMWVLEGWICFYTFKVWNRIELKHYKEREERNEKWSFHLTLALRHGSYGDF